MVFGRGPRAQPGGVGRFCFFSICFSIVSIVFDT